MKDMCSSSTSSLNFMFMVVTQEDATRVAEALNLKPYEWGCHFWLEP